MHRPPHDHHRPQSHSAHNGALWRIEARKFDGRLHYTLPGHLVDDDGERLWLHTDSGALLTHVTRGWERPMRYESDMFFWRNAWYNVYVNWKAEGDLNEFYCNVGLPPQITGTTVVFVDLDLDVSIRADGSARLLDADEFAHHSQRYNYPGAVRRNARLAVLDIIARWRAHQPPFDWLDNHA